MEENTTEEKTTITTESESRNCGCDNHSIWKGIICGLLIFLGAFCAFYTVADWHFKRMMPMVITPPNPKIIDNIIKDDMQKFNKVFSQNEDFIFGHKVKANIIHLEQNDDDYKIVIDLRAFDNNDKNLQVSTNGNILTISGRTIRKSKNNEQISEFQQNYMFGDNVKLSDLEKTTEGNYYIIKIPIDDKK